MKYIKLFEQFISEKKGYAALSAEQRAQLDKLLDAFDNKEVKNPDSGRMNKVSSILDSIEIALRGSAATKSLKNKLDTARKKLVLDFVAKAEQENDKSKKSSDNKSKIEKLGKKKEKLEDKLSKINDDIQDIADEYGEDDVQIQELEEKKRELESEIVEINDQINDLKN